MEASRWGGRIVLLSVLGMLLAVGSLPFQYYWLTTHGGVYLLTDVISDTNDFNDLADRTSVLVGLYVFLSLVYISAVMRGIKWFSFYLGAASSLVVISAVIYFAIAAIKITADIAEAIPQNPPDGSFSGGFVLLILCCIAQTASAMTRGWILGEHTGKRPIEMIDENSTNGDDVVLPPILPG